MIVQRDNIGIFGRVNVGKSSLMNLIVQQQASIVDSTPGTTADTKIALMEIHGLGPVRLFDTAGIDEEGVLGEKKRGKVLADLKECDLVLLVIDPSSKDFEWESRLIGYVREYGKQMLVVYNLFDSYQTGNVEELLPALKFYRKITLKAIDNDHRPHFLDFVLSNYSPRSKQTELLPFIEKGEYYVLVIPMDVETPAGRYLRPQQMVEEYMTRHWTHPVSFRMDLSKGRGADSAEERDRYLQFLSNFKKKPKAIITDSQAIDLVGAWTPSDIDVTTFSITMINHMSGGNLKAFVEGVKAFSSLKAGDRILIVEACNHSRIGEDIGTVQIPRFIETNFPGVWIEHNFGREFQENSQLEKYSLIVHCGGCMISQQKLISRLRELMALGIPITNYGVVLSYMQGSDVLRRVTKPWGIDC